MDYIKEIEKNLNLKITKNFLKLQQGDIPNSYSKVINTSKLINYTFKVNYKVGVKKFINWYLDYYKKKLIDTAIIYTRTNSKRLNKKSLLPIYKNKSLIEKVVENTLRIKSINRIILATTNSKEDKIYEKLLKNYNINYFYGSTNNLIQRTIKCSKKYSFNYFLRVCGDRPFFSHIHIDKIISNFNKRKFLNYDLMSNNKKIK